MPQTNNAKQHLARTGKRWEFLHFGILQQNMFITILREPLSAHVAKNVINILNKK